MGLLLLLGAGVLACYFAMQDPPTRAPSHLHELATPPAAPQRREVSATRLSHSVSAPVPVGPVAGWIIDGVGEGVASVAIHRVTAEGDVGERLATTDAAGAFRFVKMPGEGEELRMQGESVFASTFRFGSQSKGMRVLGTRRMSLGARVMFAGRAAEGAIVELHDGSGPTGRLLVTDSDGFVQFDDLPAGNYELWAHGQEQASQVVRLSRLRPGAQSVELAMQPAGRATGRVVDAEGQGVRATLALYSTEANYAALHLKSDEEGSFVVDALLPGRWQVEAQAVGYVASDSHVLEVGTGTLEFEVKLEKGGTAWGRVVDKDGAPVARARVVIASELKTSRVSATQIGLTQDGFSSGSIRWVHPLATRRELPGHHSRRFGAGRDGVRPTECGRGHCGVDIGSQRGRVVHAAAEARVAKVVRESKGKAGRYVVLEHSGGLKSFYMHLDEIHADLEVGQEIHAGDAIATIGRTGVIRSGPHLHFSISQNHGDRTWFVDPEPILLHAVVLPQPHEMVGRQTAADPTPSQLVAEAGPVIDPGALAALPGAVLRTNSEGRFRMEGLGAGTYTASAYHDEMAPGISPRFAVVHGSESNEITVRLEPGVEIFGWVHGPRGPIADALVEAEESSELASRSVAKTHTDADGRYRLRPLRGKLTVRVSAPGFGEGERSVALAGGVKSRGEHREVFELSARDRQLAGQILDAAGFPVRGASIRIVSGPSARGRRVSSDDYGHFVVPELSRGSYQLAVLSSDFPTASATLTTEAAQEIRLSPGGTIHYRVVDAHTREALVGVRVQASGPEDERSSAVSNDQGEALFPKLQSGVWKLRVHHQGYVAQECRITLERTPELTSARAEHTAELSRGAILAGILRDLDGDRVGAARVWVGESSTRTDQDGHFRLVDVATGAVRLEADSAGETGTLDLDLSPGDEIVTLDLKLQ